VSQKSEKQFLENSGNYLKNCVKSKIVKKLDFEAL